MGPDSGKPKLRWGRLGAEAWPSRLHGLPKESCLASVCDGCVDTSIEPGSEAPPPPVHKMGTKTLTAVGWATPHGGWALTTLLGESVWPMSYAAPTAEC